MAEQKHLDAESQKQRWVKYGANVALVMLVAAALTFFVVAIAQRANRRIDTTSQGIYSLKPQTLNVLKDLKNKVRIVSLYSTQTKPDARTDPEGRFSDQEWPSYVQTVSDLLEEYKGPNVEVELIDPVNSPAKVDSLINEVATRYGGEVKKYQAFMDAFPSRFDKIKKLAAGEVDLIGKLDAKGVTSDEALETLQLSVVTVQGFPNLLDRNEEAIQKLLKQKPPDYKGATGRVEQSMDTLSLMLNQIIGNFEKLKSDESLPQPIRQYMVDSTPRYQVMKKESDGLLDQIKQLGDLKLDELRQSLRQQNTILVLGENDLKVIPFNKVWQEPADLKQYVTDATVKPRFAGEQQVTSAVFALSRAKKQRVVFVRPDGAPLTSAGMPPFVEGGPLSEVAGRLADLNFEVLEKDLSGMYAMQAQMQQMPTAPDATDEQMKDAVWVLLAFPSGQRNPMMPRPPAPMGDKLKQHLDGGGSAVVLLAPAQGGESPDLSAALKPRGIESITNAVIVHEAMKDQGTQQGDMLDQAERLPFVFVLKQYGDTLLTKPLSSLASILVPMVPVNAAAAPGYTVTPILPIPQGVKVWGETNLESLSRGDPPKFDEATDFASPKYAGAISQAQKGSGRLVVLGAPTFMFNRYLDFPEPTLARRGVYVSRFPGNAELFLNSVLWASSQDALLAISPAAMEVSRLRDMTSAQLIVARVVIVGAIPLAVLFAGFIVWRRRRD